MDHQIIWYGIVGTITLAFGFSLWGLREARRHGVNRHVVWMTMTAGIVCVWLLGYVAKQIIFGREQFGGPNDIYYQVYLPIFLFHTLCAFVTISLWGYNLFQGVQYLRQRIRNTTGVPGKIHRLAGRAAVMSFGATVLTSYLVYLMLFVWYPAPVPVLANTIVDDIPGLAMK